MSSSTTLAQEASGDGLRGVDRGATAEPHEPVGPDLDGPGRGGLHRLHRNVRADAVEDTRDRKRESLGGSGTATARHEQRARYTDLGEQLSEPGDRPGPDRISLLTCCRRSRAKATNASATRVGTRPGGARERDLTARVDAFDARLGEPSRCELGLDRGAGDERHAVAGDDRAAHRLLKPELEPDVEVTEADALLPQLVLDHLAHARALLHHDELLAAQLVERDRAPGKRMTGRTCEDHLVAQKRLEAHAAMPAGGTDDAELELPLRDAIDDGLRVVHFERDAYLAVRALELAEQQRHGDRCRTGRGADGQLAGELAVRRQR